MIMVVTLPFCGLAGIRVSQGSTGAGAMGL